MDGKGGEGGQILLRSTVEEYGTPSGQGVVRRPTVKRGPWNAADREIRRCTVDRETQKRAKLGGAPLIPVDVRGASLCPPHVPPPDTLNFRVERATHGARCTVGGRARSSASR